MGTKKSCWPVPSFRDEDARVRDLLTFPSLSFEHGRCRSQISWVTGQCSQIRVRLDGSWTGSGQGRGFKSPLCPSLPKGSWALCLTILSFHFLTYTRNILGVPLRDRSEGQQDHIYKVATLPSLFRRPCPSPRASGFSPQPSRVTEWRTPEAENWRGHIIPQSARHDHGKAIINLFVL